MERSSIVANLGSEFFGVFIVRFPEFAGLAIRAAPVACVVMAVNRLVVWFLSHQSQRKTRSYKKSEKRFLGSSGKLVPKGRIFRPRHPGCCFSRLRPGRTGVCFQ